jgi:hypothetical protein
MHRANVRAAPWSKKAYAAAQGQPCPHKGMQEGYLLNTATGERVPAVQPALAVHCRDCMDALEADLNREQDVEDLKRRLALLEGRNT